MGFKAKDPQSKWPSQRALILYFAFHIVLWLQMTTTVGRFMGTALKLIQRTSITMRTMPPSHQTGDVTSPLRVPESRRSRWEMSAPLAQPQMSSSPSILTSSCRGDSQEERWYKHVPLMLLLLPRKMMMRVNLSQDVSLLSRRRMTRMWACSTMMQRLHQLITTSLKKPMKETMFKLCLIMVLVRLSQLK